MMVMILLLLANATYVQVIKADDYRKNPLNTRVLLDEYSRERGQIIAADGTPIASVTKTDDKLEYLRTYTNGPMYAPITGYYSTTYGPAGLERAENDLLNGSDDRLFTRRLASLITGRDPKGGNLQLSVDPRAQQAAWDGLQGLTGSAVALDPRTGAVLAMVNSPTYDPSPLASHDIDEQKAAYDQYNGDAGDPLLNRAISSTQPPGSTFKLVVAAAALADGKNKDTTYSGAPEITLPGTNTGLTNYNSTPCGNGTTATMEQAIEKSCNTYFAELAGDLGAEKLRAQAAKFGIDDATTQIPLTVVGSTLGEMADDAAVYQSGLGQRDVALTPMQNAVVAATIANGGVRMQPHLISKLLDPDLGVIDEIEPEEVTEAMEPEQAAELRDMMIKSENNTGGEGRLSGIQIASKTGTAEHGAEPQKVNPHAWYVAFAPAENPTIAVAVLVEDGGNRGLGATGGKVAAPIGRAMIGAFLGGR
jgi:peptidoglycan glycosyltransferase